MRRKSQESDARLRASKADRARILDALHDAERYSSAPGPLRPEVWRDDLLGALDELGAALHEQHRASSEPKGLISSVVEVAPHLAPSAEELHLREAKLVSEVTQLIRHLADLSRPVDVDVIRHEVADITREARELRAWETDIAYEAYLVDLGVGD